MPDRQAEFAKDPSYEQLLEAVNADVEGWIRPPADGPQRPLLFVAGVPRSGTTLLYQLLAASGAFAYPTNLIARFYRSPAYGARIQRLLEPLLPRGPMSWRSRAGNTSDWWEPHEFGYLWHHHLPFDDHHEPEQVSLGGLGRALAAFEAEVERPLLLKNPVLSYVFSEFATAWPSLRFVCVHRDLVHAACSIYRMRERFHGSVEHWWATRPRQIDPALTPEQQVAFQVRSVAAALQRTRDLCGPERWLDLNYVDLCLDPRGQVQRIGEWFGVDVDVSQLPEGFAVSQPEDQDLERRVRRAFAS